MSSNRQGNGPIRLAVSEELPAPDPLAFFFAAGFFAPPKRRTSRAWTSPGPRVRIADQAACTSIGLM